MFPTANELAVAHLYFTIYTYSTCTKGFYHIYSLKSLTRLRDSVVRQRSLYMVKLTNILDHIFPEYKPFFKEHFSATAIFILEKYGTP